MAAKVPTATTGRGLPTATIADLLGWGPCWVEDLGREEAEARIRRLAGGREVFDALDVLGLDGVPAADRLWVVLRPELIDGRTARLWACWCARHTPLPDGRTTWDLLDDERSRAAVEVAGRFARGEATDEELAAAWDAARDAAWDAARAAAWAAARDAAWDAARAAAWDAAWDAQTNRLKLLLADQAATSIPNPEVD